MKYNKGEWSEIYTFLKCLGDGKFYVKNSTLDTKLAEYDIVEIYRKNYENNIEIAFNSNDPTKSQYVNKKCFLNMSQHVLNEIKISKETTFEIELLENFAKSENFSLSKGTSYSKSDLDAKIKDNNEILSNRMEYSIKSQLSSPATLLNASSHTNFKYKINNISEDDVNEINSINTRTKLKDKINKIYDKVDSIEILGATSDVFKSNLRFIDGDLETILSYLLLYSYQYNEKNLNSLTKLLEINNPLNLRIEDTKFYKDKIARFLSEIVASMVPGTPSEKLKAANNVFGGILLVINDGNISLLDNLHYREHLKEYLNENLKLDSPSSKRYNMLNLEYDPEKKEATFTLNLQIRFIR